MPESKIDFSLKNQSSEPSLVSPFEALSILDSSLSLLQVVQTASIPREKYFGKKVRIHILDNIKNGHCPEDCGYCAQRKNGNSGIGSCA
jgi:biotin synthase